GRRPAGLQHLAGAGGPLAAEPRARPHAGRGRKDQRGGLTPAGATSGCRCCAMQLCNSSVQDHPMTRTAALLSLLLLLACGPTDPAAVTEPETEAAPAARAVEMDEEGEALRFRYAWPAEAA